jgi:penicillin-binding protein 1A
MNARTTTKKPPTKAKAHPSKRWSQLQPILMGALLLAASVAAFVLYKPASLLSLLNLRPVQLPKSGKGVAIYDRNDQITCTIYGERNQEPVHLQAISQNLKQAFIAAEDHDFYSHEGVNPLSVLRAVLVDISRGHPLQGGSTISQQLVKNLYFEGKKRNLPDKMAEAVMALDMERRYNKDEIFESYLNCVYFGNGAYGIERASEQYFGKHALQLDTAQSAFLAGLVNAPSELSQPENRTKAIARQQLVINSMRDLGYLDGTLAEKAKHEKLIFHSQLSGAQRYRYYTNAVLQLLKHDFGDGDIYTRGYRVYTYLDPQAQHLAESALTAGIGRAPRGINQGALVSISVADGGILAMVGGAGPYDYNQWNRATSAHTAGSAFKPFVYLTGLISGALTPDMILEDAPLQIKQPGSPLYSPRNFDGQFLGPITIRKALALSRNTCAVRVAQAVGPEAIVNVAHAAGITSPLDTNLALALGSSAVTPLEMANAYATLARDGEYVDAKMVRRVEDADGKPIKQYLQQRHIAFAPEPVAQLVDALQDVVRIGTGKAAALHDRPVAGKTGTADAARDIWFIGFTPDTVTSVWGGNDDNLPVSGRVSGGSVMASIWHDYMRNFYRTHNIAPSEFVSPENPLIDDSQPVLLPEPAPGGFFDGLFGAPLPAPGTAQSQAPQSQWPPTAPNMNSDDQPPFQPPPPKSRRKGFLKRFLDFFHN